MKKRYTYDYTKHVAGRITVIATSPEEAERKAHDELQRTVAVAYTLDHQEEVDVLTLEIKHVEPLEDTSGHNDDI